jgi:hypothetical protein
MNTQHTPGPWAVKHHEDTDTYSIIVAGRQWNSWTVAALGHSKEDEANARLIAAAPDLLAVCQELEESVEYWSEYDVPLGIVDRIRAAIAKATGGQP